MAKDLDTTLSKMQDKLDEVSDISHKIDKEVALQKAAFDDHAKQDEHMYEELKRMNDILQENTLSLKEHMQQTQLLKDTVLKIDARLAPIELERIEQEAVRKYRNEKLVKYGKIFAVITAIAGALSGLKAFFN